MRQRLQDDHLKALSSDDGVCVCTISD